ncbi:MAG: PLP-dependent aminotransferase family protein [Actinobacteria bacterium]|nr:PLP-dependent aminotransferase family protein [Actinomycetota bacterium]MCL5888146.1 PLP-dependent aminotransferase family protein [Actinomycetota bacterium]
MGSSRVVFDRLQGRYAQRMEGMRSSAVRDLFAAASRPDVISLSGGMPEVSRVPAHTAADAAFRAVAHHGDQALQYGGSEGRVELRQTIVELMAETGVRVRPEDIVVTAGAQQALDLLGKIFLDPGDVVIAEGPTYLGALQAFSAYGPEIRCVDMDESGMRMDLLEAELKRLGRGGAKFIYTIPNFQNPGGVTLAPERRRRLIELSREYDIPIIEDDPYGRLRFEGGHIKPLRALDDDVIYLGTFSKIFAPGLRLGWVTAPHPVLAKLLIAKQAADLCGSAFAQVTAEQYFGGSRWRKVLQGLTRTYAERRDAMLAALEQHFPPEARWTCPEGGFFLWVELPEFLDTKVLLAEAVERGVTFVPGDAFYPDRRGGNCMRLAFCYAEPERIEEGIRRLAEVLEDRLELYRAFIAAGALSVKEEVV